jgi:hypothetical protein
VNRVTVKFPTRARPQLFFRALSLWAADRAAYFIISIDADDAACNNGLFLSSCENICGENCIVRVGHSRGKVEAVNEGLEDEPWAGVLILASDDMTPQRPDAASYLARLLLDRFPDGDGVLHTDDGRTGRKLNTLPVMGRRYFDRFGYVYRPPALGGYESLWCDNEFQEVSESLGRAAYVDEVIVRHDWIGEHAPDDLHRRNEACHVRDAAAFQARRLAGFPD